MIMTILLACASDTTFSGTFVGNPGKGNARVASSENITFSKAATNIQYIYYFQDDEENGSLAEQEVDLLTGSEEFDILAGNWNFIVLEMNPGLSMEGIAMEEQAFTWNLEELYIKLSFEESGVQEGSYLFELGQNNWLSAQEIIDLDSEADNIALEEQIEFSNTLVENLERQSSLFFDADNDGSISEDERNNNVAVGESVEEEEEFDPWDIVDPFWQE
jgi:hypothetical protein